MAFQGIKSKLAGNSPEFGQSCPIRYELARVKKVHHGGHCSEGEICENQACLEIGLITRADNDEAEKLWPADACWLIGVDDSRPSGCDCFDCSGEGASWRLLAISGVGHQAPSRQARQARQAGKARVIIIGGAIVHCAPGD